MEEQREEEEREKLTLMRKKFDILAVDKKDREAALACGESFLKVAGEDAEELNKLAWHLLTEKRFGGGYEELALKLSQRSNELTGHKNWMHLDTLALARFETGDATAAVELEKKAIELCKSKSVADLRIALARFEAGLKPDQVVQESSK
jgi:tetratricopeptide (TPR) repeat protein